MASVSKVKLRFKCSSLINKDTFSKSDPKIALFVPSKQSGGWKLVGSTEMVKDNLNPIFKKGEDPTAFLIPHLTEAAIELPYVFEKAQSIRLEVVDVDGKCEGAFNTWVCESLGYCETLLSRIVGSRGMAKLFSLQHLTKPEKNGHLGDIEVFAEMIDSSAPILELNLAARDLLKKDFFGKSDPYAKFHRSKQEITVHQTEVIKKTLNPDWKPFDIKTSTLVTSKNLDEPLLIEVFDWDSEKKSDFIGQCEISINDLVKSSGKEVKLHHKPGSKAERKNKKDPGFLIIQHAALRDSPSFEKFIAGGMQVSLMVSIDFTLSNGPPNQPTSLHYDHPQQPSQYNRCLQQVASILEPYDFDGSFPILGFGGNVPNIGVSHCFNLANTPEVRGVDGLVAAYLNALQHVALYGPTNFAPTIRQAISWASEGEACCQSYQKYSVLLIITDGEITDMDETIDAIIDASYLAMSIIIVGVGNANFDNMEELDADDGLLSNGRKKALRDIVQFVPFNTYAHDPSQLAAETLGELPEQVEEFMTMNKITPLPSPNHGMAPSGQTQAFITMPSAPAF